MKKVTITILLIILFLTALFWFYIYPRLPILNGHAAKQLCSCVFLAGRSEEQSINEDIGFFPITLASKNVDYEEKSVTADLWGMKPIKAQFREGLGCAIFNESEAYGETLNINSSFSDSLVNWFDFVDTVELISEEQAQKINEAMEWAFEEEDPDNPKLMTRATAVVYKGQLIGEQYAPGFDRNSRLIGWSMTKSITAILYGILERSGRLNLDDPLKLDEWKGTEKEDLTIRHMLNMSSGLDWTENYFDRSSVNIMLYETDGMGSWSSGAGLKHTPGEKWYYSSGTSNILAYSLSNYFVDRTDYQLFPYDSLFARLGMSSMRMESDADGFYVGSSYSWATARDWAKFGLMLLNQGVFAGDTIVNASWVDFMTTPVEDSDGRYGGQIWLNAGGRMPDVPKDTYYPNGYHGQRILIIPSKELVIVRLGETYDESQVDFNEWARKVIDALE